MLEGDMCALIVQDLLRSWDINDESVIANFVDNGIETSHFKSLTDDLLKELCPKIGTRIHIKNKIDEYITAEDKTTSMSTCSQKSVNELDTEDLDENALLDMLSCRPAFPEFDLKTLLSTSPSGNIILDFYNAKNYLTPKHLNILTDIICRRIFTHVVNHHINHEEYNIITSKIIALFPTENAGTYFVPPVKKRESTSGKPAFAKGKLVDKIRNTLYKSGERKRKLTVLPDKENKNKITKNVQQLQELHKDDVIWLKNYTKPWEDVLSKWKATYELRSTIEYQTVGAYLENWPILNDVRSDVLINLDFDAAHPGRTNKFYLQWNEFIGKIKDLKNANLKEETANLVKYIDGLADDECKLPYQIQLLCHLVPPKGRLNKRQKFSTLECIESIIVNVKAPGDIQKKIDDISSNALARRETVQPYIIQCTSQEDIGGTFYLIVDKVRYVFRSAYKAFDTLFKCYQVLHVSYPKSGYHIYLLIQKCLYDIHTKYDVIPPYILDLISNAKC